MPCQHFTTKERYVTAHMHIAGFSLREIGRGLGYAGVQSITTPIVLAGDPRPAKPFTRGWQEVEQADGQQS